MRSAVLMMAMGLAAALPLTVPAVSAEGWGSGKPASWLEFRAAVAGLKPDDAKGGPVSAAAARKDAATNVAVIELPVDPVELDVPQAFESAVFDALEAARSAAAAEPRVHAVLEQRDLAVDDVLAVTKANNGSITVFVAAHG
jgi:hypothetical protein